MSDNESLLVFGGLEQEYPELSVAELREALSERETELRKAHFNKIQLWRKFGEIFYLAKEQVGRQNFLAWIDERGAAYKESRGAEGFEWVSEKTTDNYINLHLLYMNHDDIYQKYRIWPDYILYQVASYYLNGKDPETVPAIAAKNTRRIVLADFPALVEMIDAGEMAQAMARKIVDRCQAGVETIVLNAVQLWGVRGLAELEKLVEVYDSIVEAQERNEPFANLFVEAANTEGYVSDQNGKQVALRDLSSREIWAAHCAGRWQDPDGNGGGSGSKYKGLFDDLIKHEDAVKIARDLNDQDLVEAIGNDNQQTSYKLTLKKPV